MQNPSPTTGAIINLNTARASRRPLHSIACHYRDDLVHHLVVSDSELARLIDGIGNPRYRIFRMLQRARPDLALSGLASFDCVIRLGRSHDDD